MLQIIMMISYTLHFGNTWQVEVSAETKVGMSQFRLGKSFDKKLFVHDLIDITYSFL